MGADTVWQSWECSQAGASQHSGSSQSTRPSATRTSECYHLTLPALTLVVVNLVVAVLLKPDVAAGPVPPTLAQTLPALLVVGHGAGAVTPAVAGTPLQGAVLPIPAVGAETRSVTAHTWGKVSLYLVTCRRVSLTVLGAPGVTRLDATRVSIPALVTDTPPGLAVAVLAAVQVTQLCSTNITHCSLHAAGLTCAARVAPVARVTHAGAALQVPGAVSTAVRQTAALLVIHCSTGLPPPALPADTAPRHAEPVAAAVRVHAVHCKQRTQC